jgi:glutamyl-tRNA reductase
MTIRSFFWIVTKTSVAMLDIVLIGINHKTAPVELRECIAFPEDESKSALHALLRNSFIK